MTILLIQLLPVLVIVLILLVWVLLSSWRRRNRKHCLIVKDQRGWLSFVADHLRL